MLGYRQASIRRGLVACGWASLLVAPSTAAARDAALEVSIRTWMVTSAGTPEAATTTRPGQVVLYQVTALNAGAEATAAGVMVTVEIPEGATYVPDSAMPSSDEAELRYLGPDGVYRASPPMNGVVGLGWVLHEPVAPSTVRVFVYRVTMGEGEVDLAAPGSSPVGVPEPVAPKAPSRGKEPTGRDATAAAPPAEEPFSRQGVRLLEDLLVAIGAAYSPCPSAEGTDLVLVCASMGDSLAQFVSKWEVVVGRPVGNFRFVPLTEWFDDELGTARGYQVDDVLLLVKYVPRTGGRAEIFIGFAEDR